MTRAEARTLIDQKKKELTEHFSRDRSLTRSDRRRRVTEATTRYCCPTWWKAHDKNPAEYSHLRVPIGMVKGETTDQHTCRVLLSGDYSDVDFSFDHRDSPKIYIGFAVGLLQRLTGTGGTSETTDTQSSYESKGKGRSTPRWDDPSWKGKGIATQEQVDGWIAEEEQHGEGA
ncbi:hypothetical protein CI109_104533 [Kwoniella shandongensis]|uniref:Uncharacterized protein n=1 Tax=Kwoniella shandongensis TaxID=1734106 RepID=A0AAJ8MWI0_9TREE